MRDEDEIQKMADKQHVLAIARRLNGGRMVEGGEWFQRTVTVLEDELRQARSRAYNQGFADGCTAGMRHTARTVNLVNDLLASKGKANHA